MLSYEEIYKIVESRLSEIRFQHSKCVSKKCVEYGKLFGLEDKIESLKIAGIAHDIAKEVPKTDRMKKAEEYGVVLDEIEKMNTHLIHAKLGAAIAKQDFGCTEEICEAIKWHTTGKENMTIFQKIVYLADMTGEDRQSEFSKELQEIIKKDLDEAILRAAKFSINRLLEKNAIIHFDTIKMFNDSVTRNIKKIPSQKK